MGSSLADSILEQLDQAHHLYHRLVLVVGPSGSGKTRALREVAERTGAPLVNVSLALSRRLLNLPEKQRALRVSQLLAEILADIPGDVVLLDNTEVLFDVSLQQDPLRLLQNLSRNRTIVASWNGVAHDGHLEYAVPNHPEHRRYSESDLLLVSTESAV